MIRINLLPQKRKRAVASPGRTVTVAATTAGGNGTLSFVLMALGWFLVGGAGWYLLSGEEEKATELRAEMANVTKGVNDAKAAIDEGSLETRTAEIDKQKLAIAKLEDKKRTPVYVMYELSSMLMDPAQGGGPTIDQEKYKQNVRDDPQSQINERWDPSGLWLTSVVEKEGRLEIAGSARDAADLAEFTRRLRASVWFGAITHPDYERAADQKDKDGPRYLTWTLDVEVRRWN